MADQPAQRLAGAVGDIAGDMIGLETEPVLGAFDHGLGRIDL